MRKRWHFRISFSVFRISFCNWQDGTIVLRSHITIVFSLEEIKRSVFRRFEKITLMGRSVPSSRLPWILLVIRPTKTSSELTSWSETFGISGERRRGYVCTPRIPGGLLSFFLPFSRFSLSSFFLYYIPPFTSVFLFRSSNMRLSKGTGYRVDAVFGDDWRRRWWCYTTPQ